jgi:hypothetical protein
MSWPLALGWQGRTVSDNLVDLLKEVPIVEYPSVSEIDSERRQDLVARLRVKASFCRALRHAPETLETIYYGILISKRNVGMLCEHTVGGGRNKALSALLLGFPRPRLTPFVCVLHLMMFKRICVLSRYMQALNFRFRVDSSVVYSDEAEVEPTEVKIGLHPKSEQPIWHNDAMWEGGEESVIRESVCISGKKFPGFVCVRNCSASMWSNDLCGRI